MEYEVEGVRPRGRPKRTWTKFVQTDCRAHKLNKEDALEKSDKGWLTIRTGVSGQCFFWYPLTWVDPDKVP